MCGPGLAVCAARLGASRLGSSYSLPSSLLLAVDLTLFGASLSDVSLFCPPIALLPSVAAVHCAVVDSACVSPTRSSLRSAALGDSFGGTVFASTPPYAPLSRGAEAGSLWSPAAGSLRSPAGAHLRAPGAALTNGCVCLFANLGLGGFEVYPGLQKFFLEFGGIDDGWK